MMAAFNCGTFAPGSAFFKPKLRFSTRVPLSPALRIVLRWMSLLLAVLMGGSICTIFAKTKWVTPLLPLPVSDSFVVLQVLFQFEHADADAPPSTPPAPVSSLTFSMGTAVDPVLISGSNNGSIAVWNLNKRQLQHLLPTAHEAPVTALHFLPATSLFVSVGADNACYQWAMDANDARPQILRQRTGHKAPPTRIRYYHGVSGGGGGGGAIVATHAGGGDASVCEMLSLGSDKTVRMFHTALEKQNRELSQGTFL